VALRLLRVLLRLLRVVSVVLLMRVAVLVRVLVVSVPLGRVGAGGVGDDAAGCEVDVVLLSADAAVVVCRWRWCRWCGCRCRWWR